ncbi:hypothetical protein L208DRAFT_1406406 [Tricholoma matsutake]|nr:hypothetical protein L208DRAFT_1406406 [Tricholoma matsutake 945]
MVGPGAVPHCGGALVLVLCCCQCLPSPTHPTQPASRHLQQWEWVVSPFWGLLASLCTHLAHVDSLTSHLKGEEGIGWLWVCIAHFSLWQVIPSTGDGHSTV